MNISKNELTAALKKAFEGMGFGVGDYEDAASMVAWSETHGLHGLAQLHAALPHLIAKPYIPATLNYEDENLVIVDAQGGSTITCGAQAVDLAYSKARKIGLGTVQLIDCHNRKLIIERMVNTARRGMACVAYWRSSGVYFVVSVGAHAAYPAYFEYADENREVENEQAMFMLCGSSLSALQEHVTEIPPDSSGSVVHVTPEAMAASYKSALEQGIDMDVALWDSLNKLTSKVLVEATETSRAGAGE